MFRRPRSAEPAEEVERLARILQPTPVYPWSNMAMHYLGVPIIVSRHYIVVQDVHYEASISRLRAAGFTSAIPERRPHLTLLASLRNPDAVMERIMAGYTTLDRATSTFNYPDREEQLVLVPNSFAKLPLESVHLEVGLPKESDVYGNIFYPSERALVESFVRCALLEKDPDASTWGLSLGASIATMIQYLDIENDILDGCEDARAVEWYSDNFGRNREAIYGPFDFRVTKRLRPGKEMPVDSRGRPVMSSTG